MRAERLRIAVNNSVQEDISVSALDGTPAGTGVVSDINIPFTASNSDLADRLLITIREKPRHGVIECTLRPGDPFVEIAQFSLKTQTCRYRLSSLETRAESDYFIVSASLGRADRAQIRVDVAIKPKPDVQVGNTGELFVVYGGNSVLTAWNFGIDSSAHSMGGDVCVVAKNVKSPGQIRLLPGNRPVSRFCLPELNSEQVVYALDSSAAMGYKNSLFIDFYVTNGYRNTTVLRIKVSPYYDHVRLTNPGLAVVEGNQTALNSNFTVDSPPLHSVRFVVSSPPRHGRLLRTQSASVSVESFSKGDLESGSIVYAHDGSETLTDELLFVVQLRPTPAIINKIPSFSQDINTTIIVSIEPVNDNGPVAADSRHGYTWQVVQYGHLLLDNSHLAYTDADSDYDSNDLIYQIEDGLLHGYLMSVSSTSQMVMSFLQYNISHHSLSYHHNSSSSSNDFIDFTVFDGVHQVSGKLSIEVTEMNLTVVVNTIQLEEGNSMAVWAKLAEHGDDIILVSSNLKSIDLDHLHFIVTASPQHGRLKNRNMRSQNGTFSMSDMENGLVRYFHDGTDTVRDFFELTPQYKQKTFSPFVVDVSVSPVDDTPPEQLGSQHLVLDEGSSATIETTVLAATDTEVDAPGLDYTVMSPPKYGNLLLNGQPAVAFTQADINAGSLQYQHTQSRHLHDRILLNLTDNHTPVVSFRLRITVVPFIIPVEASEVSVAEGEDVIITDKTVQVTNNYLRKQALQLVFVELPRYGKLTALTKDVVENDSVKMSDLSHSGVAYTHDNSENVSDKFRVKYVWEERASPVVTVNISISPVNDESPQQVKLTRDIYVWYNNPYTLRPEELLFVDKDTPASGLHWTAKFSGSPGTVLDLQTEISITSFTQQQVNDGMIAIVVPGFEKATSLNVAVVTVSDGVHKIVDKTIIFHARPLYFDVLANNGFSVQADGRVTLTADRLNVSLNYRNVSTAVRFHINQTTSSLQHGMLVVNGEPATSFSQDDLKLGRVQYQHTDNQSWAPYDLIDLFVESPDVKLVTNLTSLPINISIMHPTAANSVLAVNSPLLVSENGVQRITDSNLQAANIRALSVYQHKLLTSDVRVVFTIAESSPEHGLVELGDNVNDSASVQSFTQDDIDRGQVWYVHDHGESLEDSIAMTVSIHNRYTDATLAFYSETLRVTISPVNDNPVNVSLFSTSFQVVQALLHPMTAEEFHLHDIDSVQEQIFISVLNSSNDDASSPFLVNGQPMADFQNTDIARGAVSFQATDDLGSSMYELEVSDGHHIVNVQLSVETVSQTLEVFISGAVPIVQGDKSTNITANFLQTLTDSAAEEVVFNVTQAPAFGRLRIQNQGDEVSSFTLQELQAKAVTYFQEDMSQSGDMFELVASNRFKQLQPMMVEVRVIALVSMPDKPPRFSHAEKFAPVKDMMDVSELVAKAGGKVTVTLLDSPRYGALVWRNRRQKRAVPLTVAHYDNSDLAGDRVVYVKNGNAPENTYADGFSFRLTANGVQPADARAEFVLDTSIHAVTVPPPTTILKDAVKRDDDLLSQVIVPAAIGGFLAVLIIIVLVVLVIRSQRRAKMVVNKARNSSQVDVPRNGSRPVLTGHTPLNNHGHLSHVSISEVASPEPPLPSQPSEDMYRMSPVPPPVAPKPGTLAHALGSSVGDKGYLQINSTSTFAPRPPSSQGRDRSQSHTLPRNFDSIQPPRPQSYLIGARPVHRSNSDKVNSKTNVVLFIVNTHRLTYCMCGAVNYMYIL